MDSLHYAGDYDVANISGNFFYYLEIETTDEIFRLPLSNVVISLVSCPEYELVDLHRMRHDDVLLQNSRSC